MNPDDVNEPWGVLPEGISVGDRIEGESCTDIRGRRTGTLVGAGTRGNSPSVAEIVNDGTVHFVHAGSVKPLPAESDRDPNLWRKVPKPGGGTGWMPVDPPAGSVPLPTPTPPEDQEALRKRIRQAISDPGHFVSRGRIVQFDEPTEYEALPNWCMRAVMTVVAEVSGELATTREELDELVSHSLATVYTVDADLSPGYSTDAEERSSALDNIVEMHRLLEVRAERLDAAYAASDATREERDKLATDSLTMRLELAGWRSGRKNIKDARQLYVDMAVKANLLEWGPDAGERDVDRWKRQFRAAWDHDFPELSALLATPPAGSSPVPEEPPKDWRPGEDEMVTGKSRRDGEPDPVGKYAGQVGQVARIRVPGAWIDALRGSGRYVDPSMYRYVNLDTLRPASPSLPEEVQP